LAPRAATATASGHCFLPIDTVPSAIHEYVFEATQQHRFTDINARNDPAVSARMAVRKDDPGYEQGFEPSGRGSVVKFCVGATPGGREHNLTPPWSLIVQHRSGPAHFQRALTAGRNALSA